MEDVFSLDLKPTDDNKNEEDAIELIFRKYLDTSLVWRIKMDIDVDLTIDNITSTITVDGQTFVDGMFFVLEQKLSSISTNNVSNAIEALEPSYGLPLKLLKESELDQLLNKKIEIHSLFKQKKSSISVKVVTMQHLFVA